ncbi:hypothetical protein MVEG_11590 [Podila verticillata NRRL 6337]|uniref:Protein-S-isoprenylcysteine O-methyltransferase n=1 Tax=Podila verticillata NRRL 6337 TaxID=1069443 RepID=A0A086TKA4_9FUNG|nr:hypothetical protein MVEG_11590 [Podila verticillata NRRL 6337]
MTASQTRYLLAVQHLVVFEGWHIVATVVISTLDSIRPQSSPHKLLLHTAYIGSEMKLQGSISLIYNRGLWTLSVAYVSKWTCLLAQARIPVLSLLTALSPLAVPNYADVNPAFLGIGVGLCITTVCSTLMASMLMKRVKEEEKMLKQLGRDWDVYANKRWRSIPLRLLLPALSWE